MLDVRANCSLASCTTQPFVWRVFCPRGSVFLRGGEEAIRGVGRGPRGLAGPFHQVARVHAGPRILEALAASRVHSIRWRGSTRVLES